MRTERERGRVHILLEGYGIGEPWLFEALRDYIRPSDRVAIVAFSFRDGQVRTNADWERLYGHGGRIRSGVLHGLAAYGIREEQVEFVNYFTDTGESAAQKLRNADILYFLGGLPDRAMERILEFGLWDVIRAHRGPVMGYSAGALIQLSEYHLSPDHDYPAFGYYRGLSFLEDFYLEVHYEGREEQKNAIRRVLRERGKPVFATSLMSGAIVVDGETVRLIGDVLIFSDEAAPELTQKRRQER